jgi:hypothetical protein
VLLTAVDALDVELAAGPAIALGVGLTFARGLAGATELGEQVLTIVVIGTVFGVGAMFPTGAAVPPVDPVWPGAD